MQDEQVTVIKKKRSVFNIILVIVTVILACGSIGLFIAPQIAHHGYADEDEFQAYADQQMKETSALPATKSQLMTYDYGKKQSIAIRYDPTFDEELAVFRDQRIRDIEKEFIDKVSKHKDEQAAEKERRLFDQPNQNVLLIDTAVYETGNGARTIAIQATEYLQENNLPVRQDSTIDTWLLADVDNSAIKPVQVLKVDYKEKAASYIQEYIHTNYGDGRLSEDADSYLTPEEQNLNKFVMYKGTMTFFFDEGTVADASEGVVSVEVPKSYMSEVVRTSIVKRVIDPNRPMVALTYDDGPGLDAEKRILKCLKKYNAVATFFYLGNRVKQDKNDVRLAYSIGCEIGNHSWDHSDLTSLSKKQIRSQIKKTNKAIASVTGEKPTVFRPPYGSFNDDVIEAADMPAILWQLDTLDWKSRDAKQVFNKVKKAKKLDGKIILMHSLYDSTAEATEKIVPWLQKKGYQLVTVSELINYKKGEAPKAGQTY